MSMSERYSDEETSQVFANNNVGQHSSSDGRGSGTNTGSSSELDEKAAAQKLAEKKVTKSILLSKLFLVVTILLSAAGIALFTYFYTSSLETSKFETQFEEDAQEIIRISESNVEKAFATLEDFSRTITSLSSVGGVNESFPLLTIPDFEIRARDFSDVVGASWVGFVPAVTNETRAAYELYAYQNQGWIQDMYDAAGTNETAEPIIGPIYKYVADANSSTGIGFAVEDDTPLSYPLWQMYPPFEIFGLKTNLWVGFNLLSSVDYTGAIADATTNRKSVLADLSHDNIFGRATTEGIVASPESFVLQPVFSANDDEDADIVGFLLVFLPWDIFFTNILSDEERKVVVLVESSCGGSGDFEVIGSEVTTLPPFVVPANVTEGEGEELREAYHSIHINDEIHAQSEFAEFLRCQGDGCSELGCDFVLHIFPAPDNDDAFYSTLPLYMTLAVLVLFAFTSLVFLLYDFYVQRRNNKVIETAFRTNAIVAKLFPTQIHDRLFGMHEDKSPPLKGGGMMGRSSITQSSKFKLNSFLSSTAMNPTNPTDSTSFTQERGSLADFFPAATVMFGDVKGFSAWASVRSPTDVFTLLETIYGAFDKLAKKRKILKVESIKDSYLAVCGVPTPREDHAIIMARFAQECNSEMNRLVRFLEKMLGPDTSSLSMRFGLHSGPVTAGVLRGAKARFQLFGDTVNTAARMESTGEAGRIHVSEETAKLLEVRGKGRWLTPRATSIVAKGKGTLQTYWVNRRSGDGSVISGSNKGESQNLAKDLTVANGGSAWLKLDPKLQRIVDWNTELLLKLLKQIVARRRSTKQDAKVTPATSIKRLEGATVIDEVTETVKLPKFKACSKTLVSPDEIEFDDAVENQLEDFISKIALMYRKNPFHNYEHASHVTMSVNKMLSRIVAPEIEQQAEVKEYEAKLHDNTYGITSDPLTQFAVVFSALIHDADHPGVPNSTMVHEAGPLALRYHNKSVAEQNSVDLAWNLLMKEDYKDLRSCIYTTQAELERFRQWVVTAVMSTDIVDKDLKKLRNARWDLAFSEDKDTSTSSTALDLNRKATIVVEHIIQASDISHTMQHWHVYLKWNEKFFNEMYNAYLDGRSDKDPASFWYEGEIGFFDFYIIPLAKKLKDCGVFGVSSDEYLDYALANRREWAVRGKEVVKGYIARHAEQQSAAEPAQRPVSVLNKSVLFDDIPITNEIEC